jgi:hypothetical protein
MMSNIRTANKRHKRAQTPRPQPVQATQTEAVEPVKAAQ